MGTAKLTILKETFEKQFDLERFKKFTREFFNEPLMLPDNKRTGIWKEYLNHIKSYNLIAKYTDSDDNNLIVLAVELKRDSSIDRARSMQRNFISKVLDENKLEAAIVAFYTENDPSWRLSFVRLDYSFKETGIALDLTPARRYSYLLGENEPNHTVKAQLLPIFEDDRHNPTLDEIENAFSVEKVTKDFYRLYEDKYFSLKEYLENDHAFIAETLKLGFEVGKFAEQFAKKLMGQLAFLYFLQKKGWLGVRIMPENHTLSEAEYRKIYTVQDQAHQTVLDRVFKLTKDKSRWLSASALFGIDAHEADLLSDCFMQTDYDIPWGNGNRTFIREIFDFCTHNTTKNFFDDYLEPLFYEALNTKRKNHYFKTFNCKIPFLNGGLFEPLEGYHWKDVDFEIPNELFSNKEQKGREADGILDIFDQFNFTINEDEPLEKEVAVDPEMLGKIFENLLDASDRKAKGAFYTPREIVHYMCQESLINYLVNEVDVPYEDMKQFILYGELIRDADSRRNVGFGKEFTIKQSIYDNIDKIDDALKNVKVADPAVGSGAFPLGMLNEIVKARNNITEYIIRKDKEGFFNRKFGEDFIRKWRAPYKMKWDTIKNSIFAVDIEPSAVDIAKLRLWLSVVVEQEINEENPDPHPLPNLDMNIHVGNSLIDEYEGIKLFDKSILNKKKDEINNNKKRSSIDAIQMSLLIDHTDEMLQDMFALQDRYFDEDNDERKREIKGKIDRIRDELIRYKLQRDNNASALKRYDELLKNKTKPYFIWEMEFAKIFKEKGGFDIVLGNPPYVGEKGHKEIFRPLANGELGKRFYQGKMDLFYFFFHKALDIACNEGEIIYITTNYYITASGAKNLREDIASRSSVRRLINFNEFKIFESALGQHNMITHLQKTQKKVNPAKTSITYKKGVASQADLHLILNGTDNETKYYKVEQNNLFEGETFYIRPFGAGTSYGQNESASEEILNKIKTSSKYTLGNVCDIIQGIVSGADKLTDAHLEKYNIDSIKGSGIFVLTEEEIKKMNFNSYEKSLVKEIYKNSQICKYCIKPSNRSFVLYITKEIREKDIPNIIEHLTPYKPILENKRECKQGKIPWYALHWPRNQKIFEKDLKITNSRRSIINEFALDIQKRYEQSDLMVTVLKEEFKEDLNTKYIIALLNSKLYYYWLYHRGKLKGNMLELYGTPLEEIPIKQPSIKQQQSIVETVDKILTICSQNISFDLTITNISKYQDQLDGMIYDLFSLSSEEIELVEGFSIVKED